MEVAPFTNSFPCWSYADYGFLLRVLHRMMPRPTDVTTLSGSSVLDYYYESCWVTKKSSAAVTRIFLDEWSRQLKFMVTPSSGGGLDIDIGSHTIHVRRYLSVHHPLTQMVLLAACDRVTSIFGKDEHVFRCPKSMARKGILDMAGWQARISSRAKAPDTNKENVRAGEDGFFAPEAGACISVETDANGSLQQPHCKGNNHQKTSRLGNADGTDWQQQQQQGVNPLLSEVVASSDAPIGPAVNNVEYGVEDAGIFNCETGDGCKIISDLAAGDYLNEQCLLEEDQGLGHNSVGAINSTEQKGVHELGEEPEHHSVARKKNTAATTTWLVASGAQHHATGDRALLSGFTPANGDIFLKCGDAGAAPMQILGRGAVVTDAVVLPDVWYVPGLAANLVSVSQLAELDYSVAFGRGKCYVRSAADDLVGEARAGEDGLFAVDFLRVPLAWPVS